MGFGVSEQGNNIIETDENYYSLVQEKFNKLHDFFNLKVFNNLYENMNNKDILLNMEIMFENILDVFSSLDSIDFETFSTILNIIENIEYQFESNKILENKDILLVTIISSLEAIKSSLNSYLKFKNLKEYEEKSVEIITSLNNQKIELEKNILQNKILSDDLKNKKVHEIFGDDSVRFKWIARIYEFLFYFIVLIAGLYFLGLTFYVTGLDYNYVSIGFPEKIHGDISAEFYIQKISFLVLSTTLAAFLLKRSFMNRRLADEAYRTAKELDALPRYMEGMPDEMKEKIRFDLAYKYFGNGIHHDSYTGGENLMHENIKANTEFVKVLKGEPSTTDETKASKDKNE